MSQKLKKLKAALMYADMDQKYLSVKINRSENYVCKRMTGHAPWDIWEIYQLCDLLHIPYSEISVYFPNPQAGQAHKEATAD